MKKTIIAILCAVLFTTLPTNAEGGDIRISTVDVAMDTIAVSGNVTKANQSISMVVITKGGDADVIDDVYAVKETQSNEAGNYNFIFEMPQTRGGEVTDGAYTIINHLNNGDSVSYDFEYVSGQSREAVLSSLKAVNSYSEFADFFAVTSQYRKALCIMGIPFSQYDTFENAMKENILTLFYKNVDRTALTEDLFAKGFNDYINLAAANFMDSTKISAYLKKISLNFEGKLYQEIEDQKLISFLDEVIIYGRPYNSFAELTDIYKAGNILNLCNTTRYSGIYDILVKYDSDLGLTGKPYYEKYKTLTGDTLAAVNEKIILALTSLPAKKVTELVSVLEGAVSTVMSSGGGANTSSTHSGGGGSASRFTAPVTSPVVIPDNTSTVQFKDLADVEWAKTAIESLAQKGIISGIDNENFAPNNFVTREEVVKMFVLALNIYDSTKTSKFMDSISSEWYDSYIACAAEKNLINGINDTLFGVGNAIVRQDLAVIAVRALEQKGVALESGNMNFDDESQISDYAKESVNKLYSAGMINGVGNNRFAPNEQCTRAQAAKMIYQLFIK